MVEIRLRNSMTRKVEPLEPTVVPGKGLDVCLRPHRLRPRASGQRAARGGVRRALPAFLQHRYGVGNVTYVRNITDVEDKIIARAAEEGVEIDALTRRTTEWYHEDMAALGVDYTGDPNFREPHATDFIPEMVAMIETLIARGHAYEAEGHVLFDVHSYKGIRPALGPHRRGHDRRRKGRGSRPTSAIRWISSCGNPRATTSPAGTARGGADGPAGISSARP